ncbi:hypothetical protein C9374_009441 [Naegleria lovaniensis]|uniref:Uncharacterized protein n=1 Tax=Naegleria lovaniensis TaxID=51637 RepID=A0AA88GYE8_NAELO|nr:uncharacterized protein C9374_009441 [Naegleria lovaniensis]KAG2392864.1 hypothetical protein C9374_009441 [Naegleria lovaniensis]
MTSMLIMMKKPQHSDHREYYNILLQDHTNSNRIHSLHLMEPVVSVEPPTQSFHHELDILHHSIPSSTGFNTSSQSSSCPFMRNVMNDERLFKPSEEPARITQPSSQHQGFSFQTTNTLHCHQESFEPSQQENLSPKSKFSSSLPYFVQPLKKRNRESYESLCNQQHVKHLTPPHHDVSAFGAVLPPVHKIAKRHSQLMGRTSPPITTLEQEDTSSASSQHENDVSTTTTESSYSSQDDPNDEHTCTTSNIEPSHSSFTVEYELPKRKSNRGRKPKARKVNVNEGPWTEEEHEQFLKGYRECGKNWSKIADLYVPSRRRTQIASHAQKWFRKQDKK